MINKRMKVFKTIVCFLSLILVLSSTYGGFGCENIECIFCRNNDNNAKSIYSNTIYAGVEEDYAVFKPFCETSLQKEKANKVDTDNICLGGHAFGIKMFTKGVIVVGLTDIDTAKGAVCPAGDSGISKGDIILSVNGIDVLSAEDFGKIISENKSQSVELHCLRNDEDFKTSVNPVISAKDNCYKIGLWVRDSTAGIGTVTFIDKESGVFGGLGHGVCDVDTGLLLPFERGTIVNVRVSGAVKGEPNNPGELKGTFEKETIGELFSNTNTGVFGKINNPNRNLETIPVGKKEEVTEGKIYIYTTISGNQPERYEAEIIKLSDNSRETKNFMIEITDKELLKKTGGIVQGMSGSPIIQNGKLIGAVTHVLVNNSEKGYGIFIENMLSHVA